MIPFTQYLLPNGRQILTHIQRGDEVERLARELTASGAVFESEVLTNGIVSMECLVRDGDEDPMVLASALCKNGPEVSETVDALVREAHAAAERMVLTA